MVVAAEALKPDIDEFDWNFAELQFSEAANYTRLPESEVYGRSLSTIHRLGAFMVGKAIEDVVYSPEAEQVRAEFYTSVEEGFGTDMELGGGLEVRDFDRRSVIDGRVMARDLKTPVSDMTHAGLLCAEETATQDSRFTPQLVRSRWDHHNALIVDKMVRDETSYNTRIVISPFPEEAAAQSGDSYWQNVGYVPHLRRGFVQLYHVTDKGLIAGSLSFDGTNKERLRKIFSQHGIEIPDTEVTDNWLKYAITDTLSEEAAKALALDIADAAADSRYAKNTNTVDVTRQYLKVMETAFNESYVHACESLARRRQTPEVRKLVFELADNAVHFNRRYAQALYEMRANPDQFSDDDMAVLHELLVYSTIEMMRAFHIKKTAPVSEVSQALQDEEFDSINFEAAHPELFQRALSGFGAIGARNNRTYSACGLSISLGGENGSGEGDAGGGGGAGGVESSSSDSRQSVFGGELAWAGGKTHIGRCANCNEVEIVGVKNWCKTCISGHCKTKK